MVRTISISQRVSKATSSPRAHEPAAAELKNSEKSASLRVSKLSHSHTDVLKNFDGSVRYSQGNTEVLALVKGPFEVS